MTGMSLEGADMSMGESRIIEVNGVSLHVEDYGNGTPVSLLHGWPDSA